MIRRRFYDDCSGLTMARRTWPIPLPRAQRTWRELAEEARARQPIDWKAMFDPITEEVVS